IQRRFAFVVSRMMFVDDMPQLVLNPVGAPEVLKERVPFILLHQILGDSGFVLELVVEFIQNALSAAASVSLMKMQSIRSEFGFELGKKRCGERIIAATGRSHEI